MYLIDGQQCSSGPVIFARVYPQNQLVGEGFGLVQDIHCLLMLGPRFFFLDEGVDQARDATAAKAPR